MGVHKNSIKFPNESDTAADTNTVSSFGNGSTGFTSGFGRQNNTVFGTFPNQNNQQQSMNNNSAAFGSQNSFGNNFFHNPGFFQPKNFGFGCSMSQQTTNICFTDFGEPKTNYCFTSFSGITMKKVTLVFEHPDLVFGSSIFRKPDTIVEIEAFPINNRTWISNMNDFSFSVGHIEKYNSLFIMKSANPIKLSVKVKQPGASFNNNMSSSMNYGNRKISLSFQSEQPQYIANSNIFRPLTVVEIPIPFIKYDPMYTFSNEDFMFSVGPTDASNSFEVQTSKNSVFKVTFAEAGRYNNKQLFGNRQTRTSSVFFDQGRQMNAFPTSSGLLFGQGSSEFAGNQCFGSSTSGNNGLHSNQVPQRNSTQNINGSLFGKPSISNQNGVTSGFGANQSFGNSINGTEMVDKTSPNTGGSLFGQTKKCFNSQQTVGSGNGGEPVFGQLYGNAKPETTCIQPTISTNDSVACAFGANQSSLPNPTTKTGEVPSVQGYAKNDFKLGQYQPTFGSDELANHLGRVQTKTNCITAMSEYANYSLEELRLRDYSRNTREPSSENNMTTDLGRTQETVNSSTNTFGGYNPSQNMMGNTNQAFFDQLHQLIPYLNAGSFCKCVRSCNAQKNQNNSSALTNSQPTTHSDSLANLYVNTQNPRRLNDNITIDEFYEDVFKYLEYIQKQYRHLESTLNNKNANNIIEADSNKCAAHKPEELNKASNQNTQNSSLPVFGCSTYSALNTSSNENSSPINPGSENDAPIVDKVASTELKNTQSNMIAVSTSEPLKAATTIEQNISKDSSPIIITSGNSDDAVKIKEASKTEDHAISSAIRNAEESEKNSIQRTQAFPMPLFGCAENTKNNSNVETTKSSLFGSGINNKRIALDITSLSCLNVPSQTPDKTLNGPILSIKDVSSSSTFPTFSTKDNSSSSNGPIFATKVTISNNTGSIFSTKDISSSSAFPTFSTKDNSSSSTGPIFATKDTISSSTGSTFSTKDISSSSTFPTFSTQDNSSSSTDPIFATKDTIFSSTGSIFSTKDISSSSTFPTFSTKDNSSSSTGPIFAVKDTISSTTGSIFSTKDISSSSTFPTFSTQDNSSSSTGPIFATKDTTTSSTGSIFSTGDISSSGPGNIFSTKAISSSGADPNISTKNNSGSSSIFSTKDISSSGIGPIVSTKDINSSSTGSIFATNNINLKSTGSIFSSKDIGSSGTGPVFGTSSNSRLGNNPIGLFSFSSSSKTPENSSTASNVASNDTSSSSTVGEKSTGFLSFAFPSSKPENKFIAPIFSTKDTLSFGIAGYNFLNRQINISKEDFDGLKLNDSSANKIFRKESENGGSSGDFNIVKPDNSLQCNKTQAGPSQSLQIASMQEKSDQMDEQGGCVSSQVFKMKKISEILADINEGEEERKESFSKSDTESDISNYSLISNRSSNEDCKQYASPIPTEAHPTGIVMTRYGYYILPSLEDLKSQITEDGVCVVTNFTIGRKGYGSVSFNKEINVAGLNVNDIVHFRNKEIIIYPNEGTPNEGTNPQIVADLKKCDVLVTLEQVWPHDETKHKLIKDPQLLDKIKYEDKLRSVCHKNNVHFIDYRPETGSWLFKMKQFTKTNINCWDVEDEYNVENKSSTGNPKIL